MEELLPKALQEVLIASSGLSVFVMAMMQRIKQIPMIKSDLSFCIANAVVCVCIGIPFYLTFYANLTALNQITPTLLFRSCWVALLSFIGAPSIYQGLKAQTILNYRPKTRKELQPEEEEEILGIEQ